jgi:translation initiation factor IF-3
MGQGLSAASRRIVRVEGTAYGRVAASKALERANVQASDLVAALAAA